MKFNQNIVFGGLFLFSLVFGRYFSQALFHPMIEVNSLIDQSRMSRVYSSPPLNQQINFLMILVDPAKQPQLMGVWWVAIAPQVPITFVPVFPEDKDSGAVSTELAAHYRLVSGQMKSFELDPSFLDILRTMQIPQDGYIILDPTALAIIVDFLDGVNLNQEIMDGKQVLNHFVNPNIYANKALKFQTALWEQLCQKSLFAGSLGSFEIVRPELERHSIVSANFPLSFRDFQTYITNQDPITCSVNPSDSN